MALLIPLLLTVCPLAYRPWSSGQNWVWSLSALFPVFGRKCDKSVAVERLNGNKTPPAPAWWRVTASLLQFWHRCLYNDIHEIWHGAYQCLIHFWSAYTSLVLLHPRIYKHYHFDTVYSPVNWRTLVKAALMGWRSDWEQQRRWFPPEEWGAVGRKHGNPRIVTAIESAAYIHIPSNPIYLDNKRSPQHIRDSPHHHASNNSLLASSGRPQER